MANRRKGLSLFLHRYMRAIVDMTRNVLGIHPDDESDDLVPFGRYDEEEKVWKHDYKDWGYVIGHIIGVILPIILIILAAYLLLNEGT